MDVAAWLRELGLERYIEAFAADDIDAEVLPALSDADLEKLGVTLGHRRKLLKAIEDVGAGARDAPVSAAGAKPAADRAAGAERRQLTVMFIDLVGSTELAARLDPEDLSAVMRAYQNRCAEIVKRWDGHVAKFLGDGVLAYFGWPRAHEDDAERALRAGLDLVAAVAGQITPDGQPLAARIGVATGLVVVGDLVGEGASQEEAVVGETPNLAARLQGLAAAGQVVIAEGTRRLLGDVFELTDLGARIVKGIGAPVQAFAVTGEREMASRFEARSGPSLLPMVGRDQELALLIERWARAKAGEGEGVLLVGEAGIGKSRIVRALLDAVAGEPHTRIRYQCSPYHRDSAFWPVIRHLNHAAGFAGDDPLDARLDKLEALLDRVGGRDAAPLIADLIGLDGAARYGELTLAPQARRARTLEALVAQLLGLATKQPVLVVLEDAHWIDPTTLELIEQSLDGIENACVLILLTSRPDQQPALAGQPHVTRLSLARLGRAGVGAIVALLAGGSFSAETIDAIVDKTDGVPLFVEELTKAVLETGPTDGPEGAFASSRSPGSLAVPALLHDSLMARLDRLPEAKEIAQIASVIGREFDHGLLGAVADRSDTDLTAALGRLADAELIFRRGTPPEATYVFKHALVRDVAYQSLLRQRRQRLHARVADMLGECLPTIVETEPEIVARHLTEAGLIGQAVTHWHRAGQRAAERSANLEAIAHLTRGLEAIESLPESPERSRLELGLLLTLGPVLIPTKSAKAPEVEEVYVRARKLCRQVGEPGQLYAATWGLWLIYQQGHPVDAARELVNELLGLARRQADNELLLQAHHAAWSTLFRVPNLPACLEHAEQGRALYDTHLHRAQRFVYGGHDAGVCCRYYAAKSLALLGHADQALRWARESVALAQDLAHPYSLVFALANLSIVHQIRREVHATREHAEAATSLCTEHGVAPYRRAALMIMRGWAVAAQGQVEEGSAEVRRGLRDCRAMRGKVELSYYFALLAEAYRQAGQIERGLIALTDALEMIELTGERTWEAEVHRLKGMLLLSSSAESHDQAEACLCSATELAHGQSAKALELRAARDLARLWAEGGERRKALDLLAPVYGWFTEGFDTQDLKDAKALLEELR